MNASILRSKLCLITIKIVKNVVTKNHAAAQAVVVVHLVSVVAKKINHAVALAVVVANLANVAARRINLAVALAAVVANLANAKQVAAAPVLAKILLATAVNAKLAAKNLLGNS